MILITKKPLAYLVLHINKLDTPEFSERDRSLLLAGEGDGGEVMGGGVGGFRSCLNQITLIPHKVLYFFQ